MRCGTSRLLIPSRRSSGIKAYVLPRKEEFSTEEVAKNARISNQNQGIYIYRENRLIHGPDWLGMFSKEPHFSLLRVEFSFDHKLDEAFQIDIKKSQILLNEALYDHLRRFSTPPRRAAEQAYRKGTKAKRPLRQSLRTIVQIATLVRKRDRSIRLM